MKIKFIFFILFFFFSFYSIVHGQLDDENSLHFSFSNTAPKVKAPLLKKVNKPKPPSISSKKISSSSIVPKKAKPVIILDPGHGGHDEGAKVRNLMEKKLTLRTCYLTKKHLENLGYKVIFTRAQDVFISLSRRVNVANRRSHSLFVSIHYNSSTYPVAKGMEIYYYNSKLKDRTTSSKKLADCILQELLLQTFALSRGVKTGNFHVIRETFMPAVLVEAGFITNTDERNLLKKESYLEQIAKGIALGIERYVKS